MLIVQLYCSRGNIIDVIMHKKQHQFFVVILRKSGLFIVDELDFYLFFE